MEAKYPNGIIELEEMEFYAYHGCFREEQVVGNHFLVNLALKTHMERPGHSDKIDDALNYVQIYDLVKAELMETSNLLEHVTTRVIDSMYSHFPQIQWVRVKISKMNPPVGGKMNKVSITLER